MPLGKSLRAESTPLVKQRRPRSDGPRVCRIRSSAYARLVAIGLNKGDILWSVANGDALRNDPTFKALNLPLGTVGGPESAASPLSEPLDRDGLSRGTPR